jgi:hypothetical protein
MIQEKFGWNLLILALVVLFSGSVFGATIIQLAQPANGTTVSSLNITFRANVTGQYDLWYCGVFANSTTLPITQVSENVSVLNATMTNFSSNMLFSYGQTYYWVVSCTNASYDVEEGTNYSSWYSFNTPTTTSTTLSATGSMKNSLGNGTSMFFTLTSIYPIIAVAGLILYIFIRRGEAEINEFVFLLSFIVLMYVALMVINGIQNAIPNV